VNIGGRERKEKEGRRWEKKGKKVPPPRVTAWQDGDEMVVV